MFKKISYILGLVFFVIFTFLILKNANLNTFIDTVENRTFDLRQSIMINEGVKKHNDDIVIVAIDDASYEYILDHYGEWPLPRDTYAKIIDYLELQNPKIIAFDLMFVKSIKSKNDADNALINSFKKYDNVFTAMNLDNQSQELRIAPELPQKLSINVENYSNINFSDLTFTNCRTILEGILNATENIGIINVSRSDDGVLRKMPVIVKYKNKFYPQLALQVGLKYIGDNSKNITIDSNSFLKVENKKIYLDKDGSAILNWYGPAGTYTQIPMYQLIKAINGEKTELNYNFNNKIIYFGTTASSLFDIKTVPAGKVYPGVEVQATYVNNFIDNNFITKVDRIFTVIASIVLAGLIAFSVMTLSSAFTASLTSLSIYFIY
ncbi:MAG: CHASE2 domain-containing protein, partial [Candidatus Gastranaerophilaceae bacterium]